MALNLCAVSFARLLAFLKLFLNQQLLYMP